MKISEDGLELIKKFEGCETTAYQDSVGVWTIGFGHTKGVEEGQTCSIEDAESMLADEMDEYEGYINNMVKVDLQQHEFDALVAWVYNLGPTNLGESTMLKVLNGGQFDRVPDEMNRWTRAGGEILEGLVRRRQAESLMFQNLDWRQV
jgi:lysozyme|tara:strand:- start:1351 stop:1794 length:444 start_codon:yes stop_codon:yes gene_type:complete